MGESSSSGESAVPAVASNEPLPDPVHLSQLINDPGVVLEALARLTDEVRSMREHLRALQEGQLLIVASMERFRCTCRDVPETLQLVIDI